MKRYARPRETLIFILIAAILMVFVDVVVLKGWRPYLPNKTEKQSHVIIESEFAEVEPASGNPLEQLKSIFPSLSGSVGPEEFPYPDPVFNSVPGGEKKKTVMKKAETPLMTRPGKNAKVVIIIDDMGMSRYDSDVVKLKGPLTLAYLPYAKDLPEKTAKAKAQGHELMIHMPMEPMNPDLDLGPRPLLTGMDKDDFRKTLEWAFKSFDGYVGVNNHMGSKLTQDAQAMIWLMQALKARDLFFVDSKTIQTSLAAQMAYSFDLPYQERDVFLDHYTDLPSVKKALKQLEGIARKKGYAIAIGHPKPDTIKGLQEWLPTLKDKNITLVPVSRIIKKPKALSLAHSEKPAKTSRSQ